MIPRIKKCNPLIKECCPVLFHTCYEVSGKYGTDICRTKTQAVRYWLWHFGIPAKIAFYKFKLYER